jgi:hypothetical protein
MEVIACLRGTPEIDKEFCSKHNDIIGYPQVLQNCRLQAELANFYLEYQEYKALHEQGMLTIKT